MNFRLKRCLPDFIKDPVLDGCKKSIRKTVEHLLNILVILPSLFILSGCGTGTGSEATEILWDNYGVPHIYAGTTEQMYLAFGYAQMNNHANLILQLYGEARGKASEYWGKEYLMSDKKIVLFDIPGLAEENYSKMNQVYRSFLDAFTEGINKYATENPGEIDERLKQVLPVTPLDVLSHTIKVISLEFIASEDIYASFHLVQPGSNAVAIAPSRSESGHAMMITNPHLPWSGFFTWFEAHLNAGEYMSYGISLVGTAPLSMAFNNNLGWAFTVNTIDVSDRYELKLQDGGYLLDGVVIPFNKKTITLKIRQDDGSLHEDVSDYLYSKHGPVIGRKDNKAYAVKIAGLHNTGIFEQFHKMSSAKNLTEFESALKMLQIPMFNIIYADREGNIMYLFNGSIPERETGDFAFWKGTIDGSDSKYIWDNIHKYADLPKVLNPSTGFLSNCNDAPWTCTEPMALNPDDFPAYFAPRGTFLRPQRSINMIKDNHLVTFDQMVGFKLDTHMEAAERFLDDLLAAVDKYPDRKASEAAEVLKNWDKKTDAESRGAVLFAQWWDMVSNKLFAILWSPDNPNSTPDGISDPKKAVELLLKAADEVVHKYGSLDVPWGDVYRFRMNGTDLPANGGSGNYGIFRTVYSAESQDNKKVAVGGETYTAVTEFGEHVKAEVILSYGNASQPGNKHRGDQLEMLSKKMLRPALLERKEILNNLEKKEIIK